jgi:hypothetical protein
MKNLTTPTPESRAFPRPIRGLGALALLAMVAVVAAGCDRWDHSPAEPGYLPDWTEARLALESALTAWRDARSPLPASFDSDSVKFVDKRRRPDQRLESFAILGRSDIEYVRQFTVRLRLQPAESSELVRYNVLGRNPVWVFRLEDYETICRWEHPMDDPSGAPGGEGTVK